MSKKIVICLMMLCMLFATACGESKAFPTDITCKQILNAAKSAAGNAPENETLHLSAENKLDAYTMSLWADGVYEECAEFSLLADYAVYYSSDNNTYEIAVLKAADKTDAEKLAALLERRKETLSGGDKAAYDPDFDKLMGDSQILTEGEFVILLITPNNDAAITAIENLKQ